MKKPRLVPGSTYHSENSYLVGGFVSVVDAVPVEPWFSPAAFMTASRCCWT
jgi:hypothetical protein